MVLPIDRIYGKKLRSLRLKNEIKQEVMAEMLGLKSQQQYSKLERGQKKFTNELIKIICTVFVIKESDFSNELNLSNQNKTNSINVNEMDLLKTILTLKSQISEYQTIVNLIYNKLNLEKEIELLNLKIENQISTKYIYPNGNRFLQVELL